MDIFFPVFNLFKSCNRMSPNMVACIAVEAISILEKLHMKGWVLLIIPCFTFSESSCLSWALSPKWLLHSVNYCHLFSSSTKVCAWRCEARELFTWSTWNCWWEEAISYWSWFGYAILPQVFHLSCHVLCVVWTIVLFHHVKQCAWVFSTSFWLHFCLCLWY